MFMGRLRGFLWLVAGLVVAAVAALIAFTALSRATAQRAGQVVVGPKVQVAVAAHAVPVRSQLKAEDLQVKSVPVETVPEGAIREVAAATGKLTLVDLYPGEIILAQRLVDPNVTSADARQALVVSGEEVLMAFPANDLMSRSGVLKPGDHVDLLFTLDFPANRGPALPAAATGSTAAAGERSAGTGTERATFNMLQNVTIAALVAAKASAGGVTGAAPDAILLTVSPQDALVLKYAKDAGAVMDIVMRPPGNERPAAAEPVDFDYLLNRYRIPIGAGR
jgi:pilus assembly protein CpaB